MSSVAVASEGRAIACPITSRVDYAPHLFSFTTQRPPGLDFVPGQFVRLGVVAADGSTVWRAYSIASAPTEPGLLFYSIVVPEGPFTPPLARLVVGDTVLVDPTVYGFLRIDRFDGGRHLWLLATGTGLAPFRAMLADAAVWSAFDDIVLVHSVRTMPELVWHDDFERWQTVPPAGGARLRYLPTLTGPAVDGAPSTDVCRGRITTLLADGRLQGFVELPLTVDESRLMICGNPSMIKDARALLGARGFAPVRRATPGQYIVENFW